MTIVVLIVALLTTVYALTLASLAPLDLLTGAVLGGLLLWLSRSVVLPAARPDGPTVLRRAVAFVPFALAVAGEIIVGTWRVARVVLGLRPLTAPGIVKVPIGERSATGVVATGLVESLSPGSVLIDIDREERVLLFHFIDAADPDAERTRMQRFYERYQRHVFP
ncbi:MAG: Na+/H+ antiporter subunit E [Chloroflexia bacterium]|nr:Na+/H+ antiporter subunit E [Chloroflexia bacterium]